MKKIFLLLCVFVFISQIYAANITTFMGDKTGFLNTTGAISATGPLPLINAGSPHTINSLTFFNSNGLIFGEFTSLLPGNELAVSDKESLTVEIDAPVFAFGFDFVDPDTTDGSFTMTLKNGALTVASFAFAAHASNVASFIGVSSDTAFDLVEIVDVQVLNRNEFWGEFFTNSNSSVPEPSSIILFTGALSIFLLRKLK